MTPEEVAFFDALEPGERALWQATEDMWQVGRNIIASYQVATGFDLEMAPLPWAELPFNVKVSFHMTLKQNDILSNIGTSVGALTIFSSGEGHG